MDLNRKISRFTMCSKRKTCSVCFHFRFVCVCTHLAYWVEMKDVLLIIDNSAENVF